MPRKRISSKTPRKPKATPSFDYESEEFLARVDDMIFEGFYESEIADELNVSRSEFSKAKDKSEKLRKVIENARERARAQGAEMPSPALFAKVWAECNGKRTVLMKKFGIGWTKLQSWLAQEPIFVDIMAERDLEFLEQVDTASRILALGGVKGKDQFPGWNRYPSEWMIRFHLNTTGKRYGFGEAPVMPEVADADIPKNIEQGIDIESWIKQELSQKKHNDTDAEQ